jgi:hypothetical protein
LSIVEDPHLGPIRAPNEVASGSVDTEDTVHLLCSFNFLELSSSRTHQSQPFLGSNYPTCSLPVGRVCPPGPLDVTAAAALFTPAYTPPHARRIKYICGIAHRNFQKPRGHACLCRCRVQWVWALVVVSRHEFNPAAHVAPAHRFGVESVPAA